MDMFFPCQYIYHPSLLFPNSCTHEYAILSPISHNEYHFQFSTTTKKALITSLDMYLCSVHESFLRINSQKLQRWVQEWTSSKPGFLFQNRSPESVQVNCSSISYKYVDLTPLNFLLVWHSKNCFVIVLTYNSLISEIEYHFIFTGH